MTKNNLIENNLVIILKKKSLVYIAKCNAFNSLQQIMCAEVNAGDVE